MANELTGRAEPAPAPKLARVPQKISGQALVGRMFVLEAFVVALAASEAKTRPDVDAFIKGLRVDALERAAATGYQESLSEAEGYVDELLAAILAETKISPLRSATSEGEA